MISSFVGQWLVIKIENLLWRCVHVNLFQIIFAAGRGRRMFNLMKHKSDSSSVWIKHQGLIHVYESMVAQDRFILTVTEKHNFLELWIHQRFKLVWFNHIFSYFTYAHLSYQESLFIAVKYEAKIVISEYLMTDFFFLIWGVMFIYGCPAFNGIVKKMPDIHISV